MIRIEDNFISFDDIDRVLKSNMDLSHKGSELPPLNKRKDKYSKVVIRMIKLLEIFGYYCI